MHGLVLTVCSLVIFAIVLHRIRTKGKECIVGYMAPKGFYVYSYSIGDNKYTYSNYMIRINLSNFKEPALSCRLTVKEKTKFDKLKERWIDIEKGA